MAIHSSDSRLEGALINAVCILKQYRSRREVDPIHKAICMWYSFNMNISGGESQSCNTLVFPIRHFRRCKTAFTFIYVHSESTCRWIITWIISRDSVPVWEIFIFSAQLQKAPSVTFLWYFLKHNSVLSTRIRCEHNHALINGRRALSLVLKVLE